MSAAANVLTTTVSWSVLFGVFLMNLELGRAAHQRDMVDHAAAVAADTVTKTLCASAKDYAGMPEGAYGGAREAAVWKAVGPRLDLVAPPGACRIRATPAGPSLDPGVREMSVEVSCEIPCRIPFAAEIMCHGSPRSLTFKASQRAVAMGCDAGG
ncbi:MAG: hypothetical protein JST00_20630 [Deltaproteobacteria bacterium]|nr:hypothetical protein [Deltaproteobacteria bacterium]